jgi:hypothetical protein
MTTPPKAPKPPFGSGIRLSPDGELQVSQGFSTWRTPAVGAVVQTIDATGRRTTITRMALAGPFAFAMKKKTGDVHVVIASPTGDTCTIKVKAKKGPETMAWAVAFNAWSEAAGR